LKQKFATPDMNVFDLALLNSQSSQRHYCFHLHRKHPRDVFFQDGTRGWLRRQIFLTSSVVKPMMQPKETTILSEMLLICPAIEELVESGNESIRI